VHWRTERDPGDAEAFIVELALEDAANQHVPSTAFRSGFLLLYAISDTLGADGGCFCLDVAAGRYRKTSSMPQQLGSHAGAARADDEGDADVETDLAS
jgi:hypothetical protein